MPRPYHSPSSIALGRTCQRAWAYQYLDGLRDPDVSWPVVESYKWDHGRARYVSADGQSCSAAQRGAALGKAMHATAERWFDPSRGVPDWLTLPGQMFAAARHHYPEPSLASRVVVEAEIGATPVLGARDGGPRWAMPVHGILWAGYRDLLIEAPAELARIGVVAPEGVAVFDHKSTSNIAEHALTHAELLVDPQASLYAIDACEELGLASIPMRWVYTESKKIRRSLPVDATIELSRAHDTIGPCADLARELDTLTRSEDAPQNTAACNMYGPPDRVNCRHHVSNGGRCNARQRLGPIDIHHEKKAEIKMALSAEATANFAKIKAEAAAKRAAAAEGGTAADAPDAEDLGTEPEAVEAPANPLRSDGHPRGAAPGEVSKVTGKAATPRATKPPEGSQAATIAALAAELATADRARDAVLAKLRAAVA